MGLNETPRDAKRRTSRKKPQNRNARSKPQSRPAVTPAVLARRGAARIVSAVVKDKNTLDEALHASLASELAHLEARDVAFARLIAVTTLRRLGQIDDVLARFLSKPIDDRAPFARAVLQTAVTQLLFLDAPAHAVIDVSVQVIKTHKKSQHFSGLTNAVLRRISEGGADIVAKQDAAELNTPTWMFERWVKAYGHELTREIALAHMGEPALDLTLKAPDKALPEGLAGERLTTGSVRLANAGRVDVLPGFDDGLWWVQDAAASLPARLFGSVSGLLALDLCAAPGGKTAQLCAAGAKVTALDSSATRMKRVRANLERLDLEAELVVADATTWDDIRKFDIILLDAPCSATGTIRRHPDLPLVKSAKDIVRLATLQQAMLRSAADRLVPGGRLVFCTCSLEPEEGADQVSAFLANNSEFATAPIDPDAVGIPEHWITDDGFLRTLPSFRVPTAGSGPDRIGVDGFFAAVLVRSE